MPAPTVAVELATSTSTLGGSASSRRRSPAGSTTLLKEWPLPRARMRSAPATARRSSSSDLGRWTRAAPKLRLPAQFVTVAAAAGTASRDAADGHEVLDRGEAVAAFQQAFDDCGERRHGLRPVPSPVVQQD